MLLKQLTYTAIFLLLFNLIVASSIHAQVSTFPYFYGFENEGTGPTGCNPSYVMQQPGWLNVAGDDMDWTNDTNGTGSHNTGPSQDHTPGAGLVYMYLEASCSASRTALLQTPAFDVTGLTTPVASFWYHMYGSTIGTLNFESSIDTGGTWVSHWDRTGAQQNSSADPWREARISIPPSVSNLPHVLFRFRGTTTSNGFTGDIAIDDFSIIDQCYSYATVDTMISCGQSYTSPSGKVFTISDRGVQMDTVMNSNMCDSVITINLVAGVLCGSMAFDTENRIKFDDPCQCDDPLNNLVGGRYFFHDTLTIITSAPLTSPIQLDSTNTGFFYGTDVGGLHSDSTDFINVSGDTIWKLQFWKESGVTPSVTVIVDGRDTLIPAAIFLPVCSYSDCVEETIPTLSEWGEILLLILILIVGAVVLSSQEKVTSLMRR